MTSTKCGWLWLFGCIIVIGLARIVAHGILPTICGRAMERRLVALVSEVSGREYSAQRLRDRHANARCGREMY